MTKTVNVIKLANGNYVEDSDYSQGHFSCLETDSPFKAKDYKDNHIYETFFRKRGATYIQLHLTAIEVMSNTQ